MTSLKWPKNSSLRKINRGLLVCCLAINGYVLAAPFWPNVSYAVATKITKPVKVNTSDESTVTSIDRTTNRLIIPKLQLEELIHEGLSEHTLSQGLWRRPHTSTPTAGGNTVIVGHRFTYRSQPPFYHLDKLAIGDSVVVVYEKKIYEYRINGTQTVSPNEASIESPNNEPKLTLYTCTPLWSATQRLVFTASLEKEL
jgi:LPXTG-site transpeptidase (sortase) family protein